MQIKHKQQCAVAVTLFVSLGGAAQAQVQTPGLWEHTVKMRSSDGEMDAAMTQMQKQLAAMPPEKRAQIEAAMGRSGMKLGENGSTVKVCVTKEEATRSFDSRMQEMRSECTHKDVQRSGNTWKFKFECTKPPSTGEGEMTLISDKAYAGKSTVTTTVGGKAHQTMMEMSGKWIASDCGDVKPLNRLGRAASAAAK